MAIDKIAKNSRGLSVTFGLWFIAYSLSVMRLDTQGLVLFSTLAYLFLALLLVELFYFSVKYRTINRLLPLAVLPIGGAVLSLLAGSISFLIFVAVAAPVFLGLLNVANFKHARSILILGIVLGVFGAWWSGEFFSVYIDDRVRLTFFFRSPNSLAATAAVAIIIGDTKGVLNKIIMASLVIIIVLSNTRSIILILPLVLVFTNIFIDADSGVLNRTGKVIFHCCILLHVITFVLLLLVTTRTIEVYDSSTVNELSSLRFDIWTNAMSQINPLGGVDASVNWRKMGEIEEESSKLRISVDSFYINRVLESGIFFALEYFYILYCAWRSVRYADKSGIQIILMFLFAGFLESWGLGIGNFPSVIFSSVLVYYGHFCKSGALNRTQSSQLREALI